MWQPYFLFNSDNIITNKDLSTMIISQANLQFHTDLLMVQTHVHV